MRYCKRITFVVYMIILVAVFSFHTTSISYADNVKMADPIIKGISEDEAKTRLADTALRYSDLKALKAGLFTELLITDDWIAVGNRNNVIGVFDNSGRLKYCIRFTTTGMYTLQYDAGADGLVVDISRNETYYSFDTKGELYQITDYKDGYIDSLSGSLRQDEAGYRYSLKTKRLAKSLFLKQRTLVIKSSGTGDMVFLESDHQYKGESFVFILIAAAFLVTWVLESDGWIAMLRGAFSKR